MVRWVAHEGGILVSGEFVSSARQTRLPMLYNDEAMRDPNLAHQAHHRQTVKKTRVKIEIATTLGGAVRRYTQEERCFSAHGIFLEERRQIIVHLFARLDIPHFFSRQKGCVMPKITDEKTYSGTPKRE